MNTNKSKKFILAGLVGCAICCLPLLLPLAAGLLGASVYGLSVGSILCGVLFLVLAIGVAGAWYAKNRKKQAACGCD